MGFFGTIAKLAGKVVKAGASVVTQGASDNLLQALKGGGGAKAALKAAKTATLNAQQLAQITKLTPSVKGSASQKVQAALKPVAKVPKAKTKTTKAKATPKPKKAKAAKVKKASTRKPPKGGLDLAAISRAWKAAGKPGTWLGYIKANPIKKK